MQTETLIQKLLDDRAVRAGKIDEAQAQIDRLTGEMRALESAVRVYKPDHEFGDVERRAPRKATRNFERGGFQRVIIGILKRSDASLTAKEICSQVTAENGIELKPEQLANQLANMKRAGLLTAEKIDGLHRWKIMERA